MGSINSLSSTINSINQTLLNEINADLSPNGSSSGTSSGSAGTTDHVNFSQVAQIFQGLEKLQSSNPTEFKQVAADAASQFSSAAQQATDPQQAELLQGIANRFTSASQSGNLSSLFADPSSSSASTGVHGHHHHHHGGVASPGIDPSTLLDPASSSQSTSNSQTTTNQTSSQTQS